jgi:hypothetical protein
VTTITHWHTIRASFAMVPASSNPIKNKDTIHKPMSTPKVRKRFYYQVEPSLIPFAAPNWIEHFGCVAVETQQTVSMDRLAPGELPPPAPPKPTRAERKAQQAEAAQQQRLAAADAAANKRAKEKQAKQSKTEPEELEAEECENPPVFDMQDIPEAMENLGWPMSAKMARRWFSGPAYVYDEDQNKEQPTDDTSVTLKWVLKFKGAKKRYDELLSEAIYNENAIVELKKKLVPVISARFQNTSNLDFNTAHDLKDIRQLHINWQFQKKLVSDIDTLDRLTPNDLTGTYGNFNFYAIIGNVEITGEKYYKYDNAKQTRTYCIDPFVRITHIYVYARDSYSFNDKPGATKSQYLGHWSKEGMIVTAIGFISARLDAFQSNYDDSKKIRTSWWNYVFPDPIPVDMPIDKRPHDGAKFKEFNVYWPIYNKSYNDWREKHQRGEDFIICTQPKYMKLEKPIEFKLETLCRSPEPM